MKYNLVVDTDDYEAAGIKAFFFPGGEPHAVVPTGTGPVLIHAKLRTWDDIGLYLAVADAFRWASVRPEVFMPYLPGARQDRVYSGFPYTSEWMGELLGLAPYRVTVCDPHSAAALRDLDCIKRVLPVTSFIRALARDYDYVVCPDEGGRQRAEYAALALGHIPVIYCGKTRDPATGKLSGFYVPELPTRDARFLVVDDICDGGGTFVGLAEALGRVTHLGLYVTHGIFSRGLWPLLQAGYDNIYTTDSFYAADDAARGGLLRAESLLPHYMKEFSQ